MVWQGWYEEEGDNELGRTTRWVVRVRDLQCAHFDACCFCFTEALGVALHAGFRERICGAHIDVESLHPFSSGPIS
jgi:hypothetical protein